jgi:hypothetical protein
LADQVRLLVWNHRYLTATGLNLANDTNFSQVRQLSNKHKVGWLFYTAWNKVHRDIRVLLSDKIQYVVSPFLNDLFVIFFLTIFCHHCYEICPLCNNSFIHLAIACAFFISYYCWTCPSFSLVKKQIITLAENFKIRTDRTANT